MSDLIWVISRRMITLNLSHAAPGITVCCLSSSARVGLSAKLVRKCVGLVTQTLGQRQHHTVRHRSHASLLAHADQGQAHKENIRSLLQYDGSTPRQYNRLSTAMANTPTVTRHHQDRACHKFMGVLEACRCVQSMTRPR